MIYTCIIYDIYILRNIYLYIMSVLVLSLATADVLSQALAALSFCFSFCVHVQKKYFFFFFERAALGIVFNLLAFLRFREVMVRQVTPPTPALHPHLLLMYERIMP